MITPRSIDFLLIEDDRVLGGAVAQRLKLEGVVVRWAETCAQALAHLRKQRPDFVLADIRLPDGSGEDLYRQAMPFLGRTPIVFATAFADIEQAVRLVRAGADDYLTKPYDVDALVDRLRVLAPDLTGAAEVAGRSQLLPLPFGQSPATVSVAADLERVARTDLPVLLMGETGAGKEVAARMIHTQSNHAAQPFVAVNCGAIPRELMESQFFGHERGAFTGASSSHVGYFEETGEGTLFLDEIGELDGRLQAALLRVLNDGVFRRLGGKKDILFRGRLVSATNANLAERLADKSFREDLYYRIAVVELALPPLRERKEEVLELAARFAGDWGRRTRRPVPSFDESARLALLSHHWPGNIRELRNRVERAVALTDAAAISGADLFPEQRLDQPAPATMADARRQAEFDQIDRALALSGGRVSDAARHLGISRTTLWKRRRQKDGG